MRKYTDALMFSVRQFFEGRTGAWIEKNAGIDQAKASRIKNEQSAALNLDEIYRICQLVKADPVEILAQIYHPGKEGDQLSEVVRLFLGCDRKGQNEIVVAANHWRARNSRKPGFGEGSL